MKAETLVPALDSYVIKLLEKEDGYDDYSSIYHLEDDNARVYNNVINFLNGKSSYDVKTISEEVVDVFCNEDIAWDQDSDGEERTAAFKSVVKKVVTKLEEFRQVCNPGKKFENDEPGMYKGEQGMGAGKLVGRVIDTVVDDSKEIAIRMGAQQLAKAVREPLTAMLIAGLQLEDNDSARARVAGFLNSEIGLGLVSLACSMGVKALPLPGTAQDVLEGLSRELRLQSEMAIATPVVEIVSAPMRMLLTEQVLALPIPGLKQLPASTAEAPVPEIKVEVKKTSSTKKVATPKKATTKKKSAKKSSEPEIGVREIPSAA